MLHRSVYEKFGHGKNNNSSRKDLKYDAYKVRSMVFEDFADLLNRFPDRSWSTEELKGCFCRESFKNFMDKLVAGDIQEPETSGN